MTMHHDMEAQDRCGIKDLHLFLWLLPVQTPKENQGMTHRLGGVGRLFSPIHEFDRAKVINTI
jgi:hypothetical protein